MTRLRSISVALALLVAAPFQSLAESIYVLTIEKDAGVFLCRSPLRAPPAGSG